MQEAAPDIADVAAQMPWQMAAASLDNPVGGPVELCMLPLSLFKDAFQLASAAGCHNAAAQAASDGSACLDALIQPLARQVRFTLWLLAQQDAVLSACNAYTTIR